MSQFFLGAALSFFGLLIGLPIFLGILKYLCWFTTVNECRCKVFVLFGKVIGVIDEPGLHITPFSIGPGVLLVPFFGKVTPSICVSTSVTSAAAP